VAYADLAAELAGVLPGISPILASTYIKRAWREIRDERNWSFKTAQANLVCPTAIQTGTVNIVQASNSIVFDAAASTVLGGFVAGVPLITQMQVRFGGPLYRMLVVTNLFPLTITLDRAVVEPTNAAAAYSVYRAYVSPPVSDFSRWDSLDDYANGITIAKDRLTKTSVYFDMMDPQRLSTNMAYYLGAIVADATGLPLYELWPHPTQGQNFLVTYRRTGAEFNLPTDVQPAVIPDSLIMARSMGWHAGPWAKANQARFLGLKGIDVTGLVTMARQQYALDLNTIRLQDDDLALDTVYNRGHWGGGRRGWRGDGQGPIGDSKFWQSHAISW
jgi:hypothetical protein